jgi:Uma2 family endonuclease
MSVGTLVSVEEYLNGSYEPDVEYVDGALVERNVGDWLHSLIQSNIIFALRSRYRHLKVVPELRSQTTASRFRLPDVSVLRDAPEGRYLRVPAYIAIEILSEADRMSAVMEKLAEYDALGVENIWVVDPRLRQLLIYRAGALQHVADAELRTADGEAGLTRDEIFAD